MKKYLLFFFLLSTLLWSCEDQPTTLRVNVESFDGTPISDVEIIVNTGVLDTGQLLIEEKIDFTNSDGEVVFDYTNKIRPGQSGFVALDVYAVYNNDTSKTVVDVYEKEENKTTFVLTP